jgi:hypothetical protein
MTTIECSRAGLLAWGSGVGDWVRGFCRRSCAERTLNEPGTVIEESIVTQRYLIIFLVLCIFSHPAWASETMEKYTLRLTVVPPLEISETTSANVSFDIGASKNAAPRIVFEVITYNKSRGIIRWVYSFSGLHVGNEIALLGLIYRVSDISYANDVRTNQSSPKYPGAYKTDRVSQELSGGCGRHCNDFVSILDTGRKISSSGEDVIVLAHDPFSGVIFYDKSVDIQLKLDSLYESSPGIYRANLNWRRGDVIQNAGINWSTSWNHVGVAQDNTIDLPYVGRIRVESILPAQTNRADWIVIIPETMSKQ